MHTKLMEWLKPPVFENEEQTRLAHTVYTILWTFTITALLSVIICLIVNYYRTAFSLSMGLVIVFVAFGFARRGNLTLASLLVSFTLLGIVVYLQFIGEGINDVATIVYPLVIMTTGLLLPGMWFIVFVLLCQGAVAIVFYGQTVGWVLFTFARVTSWADMVGVQAILVITAVAVRILTNNVRRNLLRANQSEAQWRSLVKNAPELIMQVSNQGVVEFLNEAAIDVTNLRNGRSVFDFWLPPEHPKVQHAMETAVQTRQPVSFEAQGMTQNGRFSWLVTRLGPIENQGQINQLIMVATDITARKQMEETLLRNQEETRQFQEKLQLLHEMGIELSRLPTLEDLYRQAIVWGRERLGFDRLGLLLLDEKTDEMIGTFGTDEVGNLRDERHFRQPVNIPELHEILANKKRLGFWEGAPLMDNSQVVGRGWNAMSVLWNGDKGIGWLATDNLIKREPPTQALLEILILYGATLGQLVSRKQAEEALRESEQRLSFHVQHTPLAVIEWGLDSQVVSWNPAAETIFGYTQAEAIGQRPGEFILPETAKPYTTQVWQALIQRQGGTRSTNQNLTKDGRLITCEWYNTTLVNDKGQVIGVASLVQDITQRLQAEADRERLIAELQAKNSELERFTYTISHDLKAPLVTMKGFLGFLEKDVNAGNLTRFQGDVVRIREAADKMQLLLNDLLELSRIGRLMNPPQAIPFTELAQEAVAMVGGRIAERGVQVHVQPNLPAVHGDRQRLLEVVQNLVDNAVKFMGSQPDPRIEIGVIQQGTEAIFFVLDNGKGILPEHQEKVFNLFERFDNTVEGTGIGLSLVKRIVEVHNGRIWVESAGNGQGTTFYFVLPLVTA